MSDSSFRADLSSESTAIGPTPSAMPPVPPPPAVPKPPVASNPIAQSPDVQVPANPTPTPRVIPPPPPPRATLPPVRPNPSGKLDGTSPSLASGVGSAKPGRWSDDLGALRKAPTKREASSGQGTKEDNDDPVPVDVHRREMMPSWLISTVIHLILLLALALITTPEGGRLTRVLLKIGQTDQQTPVELAEFSIEPTEAITDSQSSEDIPVEIDTEELLNDVNFDAVMPLTVAGSSANGETTNEEVSVDVGAMTSVDIVKPMFGGRSGAMRKALLAIYGGTQETEDAVELGLQWLKAQQQKNGSWSMRGPYENGSSTENNTAATAMAVLAFMGAGNTHKEGTYFKEVDRGIKYLVGQQDRSGFMAAAARDHERMYAQAQASIALCELYAMTGDSWLRPRAQLALDFAVDSQSPEGGWRYRPRTDSDTSVTGWFVMALKSGVAAGLEVPSPIFYRIEDYFEMIEQFDGAAYPYQHRGNPSPAMTAEGLLCRQYLGWRRNVPAMRVGLETLVLDHPIERNNRDVYYWYYATQALHHYGGDLWTEWNAAMRVALPKAQVKNGAEKGSWSPQQDDWGSTAGRLYTTCLSIYCLEVYYRHLPLYSQEE